MPSQAEGWRYAEGAFQDEPPLALIGIEAAIVLGIPLAWGLAWKPYKWAKDELGARRSWVAELAELRHGWGAAGGRTGGPPVEASVFDEAGSREAHVEVEKL